MISFKAHQLGSALLGTGAEPVLEADKLDSARSDLGADAAEPPATAGELQTLYNSMLECARGQATAAEGGDWGTFASLSSQRTLLLRAADRAISACPASVHAEARRMILAVLAADAETSQALALQRVQLNEEAADFRKLVTVATAYRERAPTVAGGSFVNSYR